MLKKKRHPRFNILNQGAKNRKRVKDSWRKQRGIDSKKRLAKKAYGAVPKIGYKNSEEVRFARVTGALESLVHNEAELLALGKSGRCAVLAHGLSRRKKASLQGVADARGIRVLNRVNS